MFEINFNQSAQKRFKINKKQFILMIILLVVMLVAITKYVEVFENAVIKQPAEIIKTDTSPHKSILLSQYSINTLSMVGSITAQDQNWGLVQVKKKVFKVQSEDVIGREGMIVNKVTPQTIFLGYQDGKTIKTLQLKQKEKK